MLPLKVALACNRTIGKHEALFATKTERLVFDTTEQLRIMFGAKAIEHRYITKPQPLNFNRVCVGRKAPGVIRCINMPIDTELAQDRLTGKCMCRDDTP